MTTSFDAIIVGARCGGSATALLLARRGYRVLLVDRAAFPSDTLSSHFVHPVGVAALSRLGVLDKVVDTGTPAIDTYSFDFGPFSIKAQPRPTSDGVDRAYGPRRIILDDLLLSSAAQAGVEIRENFSVDGLVVQDGTVTGVRGHSNGHGEVIEQARVVVGADGRHSRVAAHVNAASHSTRPTLAASYYSYWADVPTDGLEVFIRPARSFGAFRTNDGLTLIVMSWPRSEFTANRSDIEGNVLKSLEMAPDLADRVRAGRRVERFAGTGDVPGYQRAAFGPGWALVGDARHHKDPCTAKGISEAFLDAEALVNALDDVWSKGASYERRMAVYQRDREAQTMPMYEFTCQLASLEPPPPEMGQFLAAVSRSPEASRDFVSVIAGTMELTEFMDPGNVGRIIREQAA